MAQKQILYIDNWLVPKLIEYKADYNKIWGEDTGRDMMGNNKGTVIGIFPKLEVQVGSYTAQEMSDFLKIANKVSFDVTWYDAESMSLRTESYYINDFSISLKKNTKTMKYDKFSFNLIPNQRRM